MNTLIIYDLKNDPKDFGHCYKQYYCSYTERFFYLADLSPPKEIPNAFFFNIDNVSHRKT